MFRSNSRKPSSISSAAAVLVVLSLAGCIATVDQRGMLPEADKMSEIKPGSTTREQVAKLLGSPSSTAVFDDKTWYYISRRTKQVAFFDADVLDQQVFVVNFDDKGVVSAVDHKDLKDARAVEPAPGATPAPGKELTFLEQILGNVGRFNKGGGGGGSDSGGGAPGPKPNDNR